MNSREEEVLTSLLDPSESLNVHCTIEVFDHLGQFPLHFFDRARVDQSVDRSRWAHQNNRGLERRLRTKASTSDIFARIFRYSLHDFEHPRDNFFQDIRFLADDFIRDLVRQRQDPP